VLASAFSSGKLAYEKNPPGQGEFFRAFLGFCLLSCGHKSTRAIEDFYN